MAALFCVLNLKTWNIVGVQSGQTVEMRATMRQYELEQVMEPNKGLCERTGIHRLTWVDAELKVGAVVSLKDDEDKSLWVVNNAYEPVLEKWEIKRGWKVGGL
jgi:hypothetical protein